MTIEFLQSANKPMPLPKTCAAGRRVSRGLTASIVARRQAARPGASLDAAATVINWLATRRPSCACRKKRGSAPARMTERGSCARVIGVDGYTLFH